MYMNIHIHMFVYICLSIYTYIDVNIGNSILSLGTNSKSLLTSH